jgi:hypothetical protein
LKANPDHEGIIKSFSNKTNDTLRELDELLNDSDEEDEADV